MNSAPREGSMSNMWHREAIRDGFLRVTINRIDKPVNALSRSSLQELQDLIRQIKADGTIRGVVFQSAKPGTFIAGADISEFQDLTDQTAARAVSQFGQVVFQELEDLRIPTVALISGACLGGGLEFALACRYRIADDAEKTKVGLPEVQLGLLPGWGGTVRLPRLIGFIEALPLILSGQQLNGFQARSKGIVHDTVPTEALESVGDKILRTHCELGSARSLFRGPKKSRWQSLITNRSIIKKLALKKARTEVMAKTGGHYPAPLAILDLLQRHLSTSREQAFANESSAIASLAGSPVTRECIRLFFLQEDAKKPPTEWSQSSGSKSHPGNNSDTHANEASTSGFDPKQLRQAAVLGAGAMGAGIALLLARKGVATRLKDIQPEYVARGMKGVYELLQKDVQRKRLTEREAAHVLDRLSPTTDYVGLKHADVVIEAVLEQMPIKRKVFAELAAATSTETVLATNTSSLTVSDIARDVPHPERVVGLHFFNPPHQMPLVEVIHTPQTSPEALAKAFAVVQRLGKTPVVVGDCAGFLVNRLLGPYMNEAGYLLVELADPLELDRAAVEFGMPMGPLALSDLVGLEVAAHVAENLHAAYGERMRPAPIWSRLKELKGSGTDKPKLLDAKGRTLQPSVATIVDSVRREAAAPARIPKTRAEIIERLVYPLINEAALCLSEGIARSADDIDLAMVFGTGFAPFRGGPMRYASSIGFARVVQSLQQWATTHPHLAPSSALMALANGSGH